jgi:DNA-nicking Smr family endonuclease
MSKRPSRRTVLPEERDLWQQVTQSVRRTARRETIQDTDPDAIPDQKPPAGSFKKPKPTRNIFDMPPTAPPRPPALTPDAVNGLDRRTAQRLKRGKVEIEARLDLHGHTQVRAHGVLQQFVQRAFEDGLRTVIVITGKGGRDGEPGILKQKVPAWLNEMPLRQWVSGVSYAAPKDGGAGALYLRIKRRRVP